MQSVLNAAISDCFIHHIADTTPPGNARYGIVVGGASQNVTIAGCRFSHTRHGFTTGGSRGTNQNGVQRNFTVANCTSMLTDTASFDTHQPAENVNVYRLRGHRRRTCFGRGVRLSIARSQHHHRRLFRIERRLPAGPPSPAT